MPVTAVLPPGTRPPLLRPRRRGWGRVGARDPAPLSSSDPSGPAVYTAVALEAGGGSC